MENCWIVLWPPDSCEPRTIPVSDTRSLAALRSRGWTLVRVFRASLPWPAGQLLMSCTHGHAELTR